jgi:multimeric flavodoxin WrbA
MRKVAGIPVKIVAVNGSPKGINSNTNVMLTSFLSGAEKAGAEVVKIILGDKNIHCCNGCYSCWSNHTGCVIHDDMKSVLVSASGADVIIFASPIYFVFCTGLFKNFIDRLTCTGNPHAEVKIGAPKFIMMSNCGFPSEKEFEILSLWMKQFVRRMNSELLAEYYFPNGKSLKDKDNEKAQQYLTKLQQAGLELCEETGGFSDGKQIT